MTDTLLTDTTDLRPRLTMKKIKKVLHGLQSLRLCDLSRSDRIVVEFALEAITKVHDRHFGLDSWEHLDNWVHSRELDADR